MHGFNMLFKYLIHPFSLVVLSRASENVTVRVSGVMLGLGQYAISWCLRTEGSMILVWRIMIEVYFEYTGVCYEYIA